MRHAVVVAEAMAVERFVERRGEQPVAPHQRGAQRIDRRPEERAVHLGDDRPARPRDVIAAGATAPGDRARDRSASADRPPHPHLEQELPGDHQRRRLGKLSRPVAPLLLEKQPRHGAARRVRRDVRRQPRQVVGWNFDVVVAEKNPGRRRQPDAGVPLHAHRARGREVADAELVEAGEGLRPEPLVARVDDQDLAHRVDRPVQVSQQRQQPVGAVAGRDDDADLHQGARSPSRIPLSRSTVQAMSCEAAQPRAARTRRPQPSASPAMPSDAVGDVPGIARPHHHRHRLAEIGDVPHGRAHLQDAAHRRLGQRAVLPLGERRQHEHVGPTIVVQHGGEGDRAGELDRVGDSAARGRGRRARRAAIRSPTIRSRASSARGSSANARSSVA